MLSEMDSDELTDWMVVGNLNDWRDRIEQKRINALNDDDRSALMLSTLFGVTKNGKSRKN